MTISLTTKTLCAWGMTIPSQFTYACTWGMTIPSNYALQQCLGRTPSSKLVLQVCLSRTPYWVDPSGLPGPYSYLGRKRGKRRGTLLGFLTTKATQLPRDQTKPKHHLAVIPCGNKGEWVNSLMHFSYYYLPLYSTIDSTYPMIIGIFMIHKIKKILP